MEVSGEIFRRRTKLEAKKHAEEETDTERKCEWVGSWVIPRRQYIAGLNELLAQKDLDALHCMQANVGDKESSFDPLRHDQWPIQSPQSYYEVITYFPLDGSMDLGKEAL